MARFDANCRHYSLEEMFQLVDDVTFDTNLRLIVRYVNWIQGKNRRQFKSKYPKDARWIGEYKQETLE
jgi:hypothetical protein